MLVKGVPGIILRQQNRVRHLHIRFETCMHIIFTKCHETISCIVIPRLAYWGRGKIAAMLQMIFSDGLSLMKILVFSLKFHWSLFPLRSNYMTRYVHTYMGHFMSCWVTPGPRTSVDRDTIGPWYALLLLGYHESSYTGRPPIISEWIPYICLLLLVTLTMLFFFFFQEKEICNVPLNVAPKIPAHLNHVLIWKANRG